MSSADNTDDSADSITSKPRPKHGEGESLKSSKKNTEKEWLDNLRGDDLAKCTAAIEAVVAATAGGDNTSAFYIEMLKNLGRPKLSERTSRLIYTYLVQLSTVKPDLGLLAAGSFTKNTTSESVLTRAWALGAFCAMRVPNFAEYSIPLLRKMLQDKDPYVRKTAVVCVAKLFDIDTDVTKEAEVIAKLREGISAESSPISVSNRVAVLRQISEETRQDHIKMDQNQLLKLVTSLSDTNEWGQIELLDCLAQYDPTPHDAEQIVLRILPRLRHINSSVVMSTIKVMLAYMDKLTHANLRNDLLNKRIPSALITIIAHSPPEIQYVALCNIRLIVQKYPEILRKHLASFFCKHEEPLYVKKEKLKVLELLSTEDNKETLLQELVLYSQYADVNFARYATGCIADLGIKYPKLADSCVNSLRDACTPQALHHVHEVLSFLPTILRRYPKKYDAIAAKLVERFYAELEEPEARAAAIWVLGECSSHFSEFIDVLTACIGDFAAEPALVQLQLITATAKLFLLYSLESGSGARKKAQAVSGLLDKVLAKARQDGANADVIDRAFFYTRLLAAADSTELAAKVVLCDKPTPQPQRTELTPEQLHALLLHLGSVQSVVQSVQDLRPPFKFQRQGGDEKTILEPEETGATEEADGDNLISEDAAAESDEGDAEADKNSTGDNDNDSDSESQSQPKPQASPPPQAKKPVELDLLSAFQ